MPRRAESMVIEWSAIHQQELMQNWNQLQNDQPALYTFIAEKAIQNISCNISLYW